VIHNHPGGDLEPSGADIGIASTLGAMGVGFFIIDSACERAYVVVRAFAIPEVQPLDISDLERRLAPDGELARALEDYEHRPTQLQMLQAVAGVFNDNRLAVIEAGTGTGKSLAYLLPAIRWARSNHQRVVISTSTINLQEQLIHKDLPFLRGHMGEEFHAVLVKGRTNYLCRRKLEAVMRDRKGWDFTEPGSAEQLEEIAAWAERTEDGSLSDLSFQPSREVWERVESHSDTTLRVRCPHHDKCFFYRARRRAARADLLVVNHSLLMSDLSIRQASNNWGAPAALPPYHRVILDEAHNVEAAATSHFTRQVTRGGVMRQLGRLIASRRRQAGLIPAMWRALCDAMVSHTGPLMQRLADDLEGPLREMRFALGEEAGRVFDVIEDALVEHSGREPRPGEEITVRLTEDAEASRLWRDALRPGLEALARGFESLLERLRATLRSCEEVDDETAKGIEAPLIELRAAANQLAETASICRFLARGRTRSHCHWFSLRTARQGPNSLALAAAPLSVAEALRTALFERFPSVVMTSATLSVAGRFDHLERELGLEGLGEHRLAEMALPAPFDYERQALVAVSSDLPDPGSPESPDALARVILPAVLASRGRAFVLFTSYRMLQAVADRLSPSLAAAGLRPLRQGETNRLELLRRFRADPAPVLFATASFWEGVDVRGDGLVNLILTRLPFQVPTDPLLEARAEALAMEGGDPFTQLQLPRAVIKFKQGFGRLIRHRSDRGCVLLLDSRLVRRGYGRTFLRSLPTAAVRVLGERELVEAVGEFFGQISP
ncbi:helicase, partial [Candidatus Sumerlaeota bacterium]|nr:helicase [Candidatus Sumerlaeota bacterium]